MNTQLSAIDHLLRSKSIKYRLGRYGKTVKTASQAAQEIGILPENMLKSLLFKNENNFFLFLIPSNKKINIDGVNIILKTKLIMASKEEVKAKTGYEIGSVTPFNLKSEMPVYIEQSSLHLQEIGIASGVRGEEVILSPANLQEAVSAIPLSLIN
jgi:Cys-tRNA(Pro)/Cys-tRNA(Cys) deacylase